MYYLDPHFSLSSCFLVNTADRIIRVYESGEVLACGKDGEPEPIQKLQDLVNRTPWKKCCFSGDGEYIVAGTVNKGWWSHLKIKRVREGEEWVGR